MTDDLIAGSFRDPSGSLFFLNGSIYRRVNQSYGEEYDQLMSSGLYAYLVGAGLLIKHEEVKIDSPMAVAAYRVLKPELLPFVSYPYEWCFSQLKDAALTTLEIQKRALEHGMTLRDCSAYNIQFHRGSPVLIDTLSFRKYIEGYPWAAYRQFCQHFLAPLVLMSRKDVRLGKLLRIHIDGIPLDLASTILPRRTYLSFGVLVHVHLHAKAQKRYENAAVDREKIATKVSKKSLLGIVDSLESAVRGLKWGAAGTEWADYYEDDSYTPEALEHKKELVGRYLGAIEADTIWDLGANTGVFSRIAAKKSATVVSFDMDPACVELNYLKVKKDRESNILPLLLDFVNPSPRIGWAHEERQSLIDRGPADAVMALALIHHLAISNNVPLGRIADFLGNICTSLIIEFVPKTDPKVKRLLATRIDIFPNYTREGFEEAFSKVFTIGNSQRINHSERTLYLMRRK